MTILGIDPGTSRIGYGIIKKLAANKLELLDAGLLAVATKGAAARGKYDHLKNARGALEELIRKFKPEILAIEKIYFMKNQKTGISVAEMRGVLIATATENNLEIDEYSPNEIKTCVTGYGFADKKAVLKMVRLILNKPDLSVIDDASDAIAAAIASAGGIHTR